MLATLLGGLAVAGLGLSPRASAQQPPPATQIAGPALPQQSASSPAPASIAAAPDTTPAATGRLDPNVDRGVLLPTAMTQPAGSITYNNYELFFHGLSYGFTDGTQATITVMPPIFSDMPVMGLASIKHRFRPANHFYVALQGSAGFASESRPGATAYELGAGAFASLCIRSDCSSLLTVSGTYNMFLAAGESHTAQLVIYGVSLVHSVTPHLKLVGEITSAAALDLGRFENAPGALASYCVRFHGDHMASDIGFVKPIANNGDDGGLAVGFPFLSFAYRWR